jgi:hypothetical protein
MFDWLQLLPYLDKVTINVSPWSSIHTNNTICFEYFLIDFFFF